MDTAQTRQTTPLIVVMMIGFVCLVAGCGQKGALYLPQDAENDATFIVYDSGKISGEANVETTSIDESVQKQTPSLTSDASVPDSQDY